MAFIVLDRDGVINRESDRFIKSPDEWQPVPRSLAAIADLTRAGYSVVVATNQSGLARGLFDRATLDRIHARMRAAVAAAGGRIAAIYVCPHGPEAACACRKPKPGLLLQFADEFRVNLAQTFVVGDAYRDLEAARRAGARPVLVCTGRGRDTLLGYPELDVPVFDDLYAFSQHLLLRHP